MITEDIIREAETVMEMDDLGDNLEYVGCGMFKMVYWLPSRKAVVKVINRSGYYNGPGEAERRYKSIEFEWALYVIATRMGDNQFYPHTVWAESEKYGLYMIQEPVSLSDNDDFYYSPLNDYIHEMGICDVHSENYGLTKDGRMVVLDWGYDYPEGAAAEVYSSVEDGRELPTVEYLQNWAM